MGRFLIRDEDGTPIPTTAGKIWLAVAYLLGGAGLAIIVLGHGGI